jgi:phosphoribosyl 1,2-cyclic phosphodiesterase
MLLEFNHDLDMLMAGSYPEHLKRRVAGDWGHLNNLQAAALLEELGSEAPECLVVAHISEKNNLRERAEQALAAVSRAPGEVVWAAQSEGFDWLQT